MMYGKLFMTIFKSRNLLTNEQMKKLNTKRLLAYFKKHRRIQYYGMCGCGCQESLGNVYDLNPSEKKFHEDCISYVNKIRLILNSREHVLREGG